MTPAPGRQAATEANRRAWNASAVHHGTGPAWDRLVHGFATPGFFRAAAGLLAEGGCLVVYETHPFLEMFDPAAADPFLPARPYFASTPSISEEAIVYDGGPRGSAPPSFWFVHRLGEVVTGCVGAGLRIERLEEFPHSNREAEYDIYEARPAQLPLCYTLVAQKPAP